MTSHEVQRAEEGRFSSSKKMDKRGPSLALIFIFVGLDILETQENSFKRLFRNRKGEFYHILLVIAHLVATLCSIHNGTVKLVLI